MNTYFQIFSRMFFLLKAYIVSALASIKQAIYTTNYILESYAAKELHILFFFFFFDLR